jgi:glycosyltransferase involved in cell wall biosynthesis
MNYAGKMGIIDKVTFFKIRKDTNELLQGMDIFLFPSLFEGLPLALVEAQTTGISVFASKNISNQAMLTKNIRLLDIRLDAKVWAQEIYENFPYERLNCSKEIISKGYDIQNTIQYLTEIYLCNYEQ